MAIHHSRYVASSPYRRLIEADHQIGAVTGLVALCALPFLPDTPLTTRWLSAEEKQLAHERLFRDRVDIEEKGSTFQGLKQAVSDPRVSHSYLARRGPSLATFCPIRHFCHKSPKNAKWHLPSMLIYFVFHAVLEVFF